MAQLPQSVNCRWISQESIPHQCLPFRSYRRINLAIHRAKTDPHRKPIRVSFSRGGRGGRLRSLTMRDYGRARAARRMTKFIDCKYIRLDRFRRTSLRRVHVLQIISARHAD